MYAGFYDRLGASTEHDSPCLLGVETVVPPAELRFPQRSEAVGSIEHEWQEAGFSIVGSGLVTHASGLAHWIKAAGGEVLDSVYPSAETIARIVRSRFASGEPADALALRPSYVRSKVATKTGE